MIKVMAQTFTRESTFFREDKTHYEKTKRLMLQKREREREKIVRWRKKERKEGKSRGKEYREERYREERASE